MRSMSVFWGCRKAVEQQAGGDGGLLKCVLYGVYGMNRRLVVESGPLAPSNQATVVAVVKRG